MKRKIGRLCMVLGAVLILCAAGLLGYNRWDAARAEKASQEVLGELEQTMQKTITEHQQENETAAPQPVLDPTQEMTTVEVEGRDYIGVLSIPAVERELPVMAQWSYAGLKIAPGRYSGTTYGDDLVICGHNYAMHFSPIKWLAIGSSVYFTDADGLRWSYEVESVETLRPTQIEEMTTDTETDNWDLTLFTCTSGGGSRYAVRCVRTPKAEISIQFFKKVQNKIRYAIHGQTAAEAIYTRADAEKEFMGLTTFSGSQPTLKEAVVAKNYLNKKELRAMGQLVSGYLDFAERQAEREQAMTMQNAAARI